MVNETDEYELGDIDGLGSNTLDEPSADASVPAQATAGSFGSEDVRRKAFLVVGLVVTLMVGYKLYGWIFHKKTLPASTITTPAPVAVMPLPQVVTPPPVSAMPSSSVEPELQRKLSALSLSQDNVRGDISAVNGQLSSMQTSLSELGDKISTLNQQLAQLTTQLQQQASELQRMTMLNRPKPMPKKRTMLQYKPRPSVTYSVQAVIPGRAWLIANNGRTVTVREGITLPGYGVIKLIDPNQGRIITSSGRVITFSQADS
ncbi:MAG: type IVB secretion system protein IcmG/DotF [Legionellaceae bacterium]|nr:type IVB secretion system protein IcmG/DotF [Legionellaceae bacterium]